MMRRNILVTLAAVLLWAAAAVSGRVEASMGMSSLSQACPPGFALEDGVVMVDDTVTVIPPYAFADRQDVVEVRCGADSQLREIGEYAFLGCGNLREVALPPTVRVLGEGCLRECGSLRSLTVPDSVEALPKYLFAWDGALERVELPAGLRDIGSHSFAYCVSLGTVAAPETIIEAGPDVTVTVLETIGDSRRDESSVGALIPDGVTHIGSNAFAECRSLIRAVLPASVTELESYAFAECISLREAVLPANDSLLGELIFSGCRSLTALYEYSPVPPRFDCDSYIFEPDETQLYRQCRLVTLPAAAPAYARAPGWCLFDTGSHRDL